MAKKKKNLGPRRKRMKQEARLQSAKAWIEKFKGKNLIKSYSKWFAVDLVCAMKELELLGHHFTEKQKKAVQQNLNDKIKQRQLLKARKLQKAKERELLFEEECDDFAFVAGFTEGGVPFGITYSEMEEIERREDKIKSLTDPGLKWVDEHLRKEGGWLYAGDDDSEDGFRCLEYCDENLIDWAERKAAQSAVERVAASFQPSDKDIPR